MEETHTKKSLGQGEAKNGQNCLFCLKRENCKIICPDIEALLPKPRSGGHKKEITTEPAKMDNLISTGIIIRGIILKGKGKGEAGAVVVSAGKRKSTKKWLYSEGYVSDSPIL